MVRQPQPTHQVTYQFKNDKGEIVERMFPIGGAPTTLTENDIVYTRVYTVPSIVFRGPGFYHTDSH